MDETSAEWLATVESSIRQGPIGWARIISVRLALRAFPISVSVPEDWFEDPIQFPFRALFLSWAAENTSDDFIAGSASRASVHPIDEFGFYRDGYVAARIAAMAAATFINITRDDLVRIVLSLIDESRELDDYTSTSFGSENKLAADGIFLSAISSDFNWLVGRGIPLASRMLTSRRLWSAEEDTRRRLQLTHAGWFQAWSSVASKLLKVDPNYAVWIDWYQRRIMGADPAFDIPGDFARKEDKAILRRVAEATDEDFWGKGYKYVNAKLTRWLEEARARAASHVQYAPSVPPQDPEQVAAALLRQASPQARITDGKLDVGPNALFDQPQHSDNLAELPSELLAFTGVILNSLPRNCEAVVRHCFAAFRDELLARGNRPILNILKAMAASLIAELYGADQAPLSPDLRELKDPREWGDGMAAMFAQFFKGYHDLIHHFPLDPEREALIAATPIDEAAASGAALTEPVDAVAALILELGKQGFATDNIVRIIEAHQLYNRDVSQLPPPGQANQTVTPKRRHVLSTAGFYLHTYSVLGSTASIYALQTVPAVQALMLQLERAANALLALVR